MKNRTTCMDEDKKIAILAIIIGGTSLLHNALFSVFFGIATWGVMGALLPESINVFIFERVLHSNYLEYAVKTTVGTATAFTCWIVVMMTKRKHLAFVTVSSCLLYVLIVCYITLTGCFSWSGWLKSIYFYISHMILYIIGIFFVKQIIDSEKRYKLSKTEGSGEDVN